MTVATEISEFSFVATGDGTAVSVPFQFRNAADFVVTADGVAQVAGTNFTISGVYPAAVITPLSPHWASGAAIVVKRVTPRKQEAEIIPGIPLPADSIEKELDRIQFCQQEQDADLSDLSDRAVKVPSGATAPVLDPSGLTDGDLLEFYGDKLRRKDMSAAANKFAAFNSAGDLIGVAGAMPEGVPATADYITYDVDRTVAKVLEQLLGRVIGVVNVEDFGAGVDKTAAQNQTAITAAIASIPAKHRYNADGGEASPYATRGTHILLFPNPNGEYLHNGIISVPGNKCVVFAGNAQMGAVLRYTGTGDIGIRFLPGTAQAGGFGFRDFTYMAADIGIIGGSTGLLIMERFYHFMARNRGMWMVDSARYVDADYPSGLSPATVNVVWWIARDCIFEGSAYSNITVEASTKLVGDFDRVRSRLAGKYTMIADCEGIDIRGGQFFGVNEANAATGAYIWLPGAVNNNTNIYIENNLFSSEQTTTFNLGAEFGGSIRFQAPRQSIAFGPITVDPATAAAPTKTFSNVKIRSNDFAGQEAGIVGFKAYIWENANILNMEVDGNVFNGGAIGTSGTASSFIIWEVAKLNGRTSGTLAAPKRFGNRNYIQPASWGGQMFSNGGAEWINLLQESEPTRGMPIVVAAASGDVGLWPDTGMRGGTPTFNTNAHEKAFQLRWTPTSTGGSAILCEVKFARPCKNTPIVMLTPANSATRTLDFNVESESAAGFKIRGDALTSGTAYRLNVVVLDHLPAIT